jgi:hypothetical protein
MHGQVFDGPESIRELLVDLWRHLDANPLMSVYRDWIERIQKVTALHEDCYSKLVAKIKFC